MRKRAGRGGHKPTLPPFEGAGDPESLCTHMQRYLAHMGAVGQSPHSVTGSRVALSRFIRWCQERSVTRPSQVDRPLVERYQQSLFHHRKGNGEPLAAQSQKLLLSPVRFWFRWMVRQGYY